MILITDSDLDGLGCEFLARKLFNDLEVVRANHSNIKEEILAAISKNPAQLCITDIWPDNPIDELLEFSGELYIFDHHGTSEKDQKRTSELHHCCHLSVGEGECSALKLANYFDYHHPSIEYINQYDLSGTIKGIPGKLNQLYWHLDPEDMLTILDRQPIYFNHRENSILSKAEQDRKYYLDEQYNTLTSKTIKGQKVACIDATDHKHYIYQILLETYDYVTIIDRSKETLGFRGRFEGVDEVAEIFGGGGHPCASGAPGSYTADEIFSAFTEVLSEV